MKLLQDTESLQERQRRWNSITSPAMVALSKAENTDLKSKRGKFAGVFTRLVARGEKRGLHLTPDILVQAANHSWTLNPHDPAKALRDLADNINREQLRLELKQLTEFEAFKQLIGEFGQTQQTLL